MDFSNLNCYVWASRSGVLSPYNLHAYFASPHLYLSAASVARNTSSHNYVYMSVQYIMSGHACSRIWHNRSVVNFPAQSILVSANITKTVYIKYFSIWLLVFSVFYAVVKAFHETEEHVGCGFLHWWFFTLFCIFLSVTACFMFVHINIHNNGEHRFAKHK